MSVDTHALTTVAKAKNHLHITDADLYTDAISIYCDASDATAATVEVTDTTMVLIITGGADAGTTTKTFADSTDDTLTELVATVNAVSGWTANLQGIGAADTGDLVITPATSCLLAANEATFQIVNNYLLERLIDRASDLIESLCHRKFASRSYTSELYDGTGLPTLQLDNWPVTAISRLSADWDDAISVKCTSTCAWATVEVTSTSVILTITGGTDAGTTTLLFADYATITLMSAQITATTGFTSSIINSKSIWPSSYLKRLPAQHCVDSPAYLQVPGDPLDDYEYNTNTGIVTSPSGFAGHVNSISVDYTGGYTTIPDDLEQVCLELVGYLYNLALQDTSVQSEHIGDYSYTQSSQQITNNLSNTSLQVLESYKRLFI